MGIQTAMDAVYAAPGIVDALRLADDVAFEAGRDPGVRTLRLLAKALASDDDVAAITAVHALAEMYDEQAARALSSLLSDERGFIREHAAWALGAGLPRFDAIGRLLGIVAAGGFSGMLAQRTLENWSITAGETLAVAIETALLGIQDAPSRARLVETLGLVRAPIAARTLLRCAGDPQESRTVRIAAVAALGQRAHSAEAASLLDGLADGEDELADAARLALVDLASTRTAVGPARNGSAPTPGPLTVAQLFLHADIDPSLTSAGVGDNGGIATLLVRLGDALVADPSTGVQRVVTLSRGPRERAVIDLGIIGMDRDGHVYGRVPLADQPVPSAAAWSLRVPARRGIRRILRAAGRIDVLHLRMADVGSLAAADVARELGIPVVFTVAPDPHAVIQSMDLSGALHRSDFGEVDMREHFWFRARLVQSLASNAAHTVLFPRPKLEEDMRQLVGIDISSHPERHTIVAEGVDLDVVDRAVSEIRSCSTGDCPTEIEPLRALLEELPDDRRRLPLLVSVGRLHRVKGMATLVEAWARGPLADRANLLIIGGDLEKPSLDEREQLERIAEVVPDENRAARGLVLAGHRPNDIAARWLAAVRFGMPGLAAAGGVYVCASVKEEFGIALLEAMATGLTVVAPDGGGPATYVTRGDTGVLTQTWDVASLTQAIADALDIAAERDDSRAERSHDMVRERFTIQGMASALGPVYGGVAREEAELIRAAGVLG